MNYPVVIHHGGIESVTGSCHQLSVDEYHSVLIDCGLRLDKAISDDSGSITDDEFRPEMIKALILTHAHIDHVGRIPELLAAGYRGPGGDEKQHRQDRPARSLEGCGAKRPGFYPGQLR